MAVLQLLSEEYGNEIQIFVQHGASLWGEQQHLYCHHNLQKFILLNSSV
jgi:hypothetical protein